MIFHQLPFLQEEEGRSHIPREEMDMYIAMDLPFCGGMSLGRTARRLFSTILGVRDEDAGYFLLHNLVALRNGDFDHETK